MLNAIFLKIILIKILIVIELSYFSLVFFPIQTIIMHRESSHFILGWELNILESVVITLAIGLSVDFTLHYGIMYKLAVDTDRS